MNAFLIFLPQSVTMAGKSTFKPNSSNCSLAKPAITMHTVKKQENQLHQGRMPCSLEHTQKYQENISTLGAKLIQHLGYGSCMVQKLQYSPWWSMETSCTGKAPSTRFRSTHLEPRLSPRISIQWAVIVKYSFMHLECHRSHVKAGFASFQLLSLLNFLTPSAYKLDICEKMQGRSPQK